MDLESLYGGSFVNWEAVGESWNKRTVPSRLLLMSARNYLKEANPVEGEPERVDIIENTPLPAEIKRAFSSPPEPDDEASGRWGGFIDAAVVAELEVISYGERPPILHELRAGLKQAAEEAGPRTPLGRWFIARREALPGKDLPGDAGYLPV